jgi:D-arabinose 1-dehydrogenase-like Zn-dependent alcohol dehydrogenase
VLLNDFPTMAKGGRRGVSWCSGYQSEGSFALEVGVAHRSRAHLPHFRYVSLLGVVPLICNLCTTYVSTSVHTVVMLVLIVILKKYSCSWT